MLQHYTSCLNSKNSQYMYWTTGIENYTPPKKNNNKNPYKLKMFSKLTPADNTGISVLDFGCVGATLLT